jgi:pimeloyl-ACP methyl ester carboxylesterase
VGDYARIVGAFVTKLGLEGVALAGHSLGGAIAQELAIQSPDWLSRIVLLGTGCRLRVLPDVLSGLMGDYENTIDLVNRMMFGPDADPALVGTERETYLDLPPEITHGDLSACDAFDVSDRLSSIRVPALVISGENDRLTPVKYGRYLHRHIPESEMIVIERAGHMMALEKPEDVVAAIRTFIC